MWTLPRISAYSPSQPCSQDLRGCSRKGRAEHPWQKGGPLSLVQVGSVIRRYKTRGLGCWGTERGKRQTQTQPSEEGPCPLTHELSQLGVSPLLNSRALVSPPEHSFPPSSRLPPTQSQSAACISLPQESLSTLPLLLSPVHIRWRAGPGWEEAGQLGRVPESISKTFTFSRASPAPCSCCLHQAVALSPRRRAGV